MLPPFVIFGFVGMLWGAAITIAICFVLIGSRWKSAMKADEAAQCSLAAVQCLIINIYVLQEVLFDACFDEAMADPTVQEALVRMERSRVTVERLLAARTAAEPARRRRILPRRSAAGYISPYDRDGT